MKTNNTEHTPGPWTITGPSSGQMSGMDDGGDYAIIADNQIIIEVIHRTGKTTFQPALANAEFIIRACSAHDELVAFIQTFIKRWGKYPKKPTGEDLEIYLDEARTALAKAEAKPT